MWEAEARRETGPGSWLFEQPVSVYLVVNTIYQQYYMAKSQSLVTQLSRTVLHRVMCCKVPAFSLRFNFNQIFCILQEPLCGNLYQDYVKLSFIWGGLSCFLRCSIKYWTWKKNNSAAVSSAPASPEHGRDPARGAGEIVFCGIVEAIT